MEAFALSTQSLLSGNSTFATLLGYEATLKLQLRDAIHPFVVAEGVADHIHRALELGQIRADTISANGSR